MTQPDPWETARQLAAHYDATNSDIPAQERRLLQILKIGEEYGEVAQAVVNVTGTNKRKGLTHTWDDVTAEVCDVLATAMITLYRLGHTNPPALFAKHLAKTAVRDLLPRKDTDGCIVVIMTRRGEVVLNLRDGHAPAWPGYWSVLGGKREPEDTEWIDTAYRETKEEAGIVPDTLFQVDVTDRAHPEDNEPVFFGLWDGTEDQLICGEGDAIRLCPLGELPEHMPPHITSFIHQLTNLWKQFT